MSEEVWRRVRRFGSGVVAFAALLVCALPMIVVTAYLAIGGFTRSRPAWIVAAAVPVLAYVGVVVSRRRLGDRWLLAIVLSHVVLFVWGVVAIVVLSRPDDVDGAAPGRWPDEVTELDRHESVIEFGHDDFYNDSSRTLGIALGVNGGHDTDEACRSVVAQLVGRASGSGDDVTSGPDPCSYWGTLATGGGFTMSRLLNDDGTVMLTEILFVDFEATFEWRDRFRSTDVIVVTIF